MSFQAAVEHAKERAAGLKGQWRQLTGEIWGAVKAATWFAEAFDPELPLGDLATLRKTIASLEGQLASIDGQLGVAHSEQATAEQRAGEERLRREQAARAREEAERVQRRIAKLRTSLIGEGAAKAERETAALGVEQAERAWEQVQAMVPATGAYTYTCGSCGRTAVLVAIATEHPSTEPTKLIEPEDNERADLRVAVVQAKRVLADAERQLESFDRTKTLLAELEAMQFTPPPAEPEPAPAEPPPSLEPLLDLEAKRQTLATQLQEARTAVRRVEDHQQRVAQAKQRTADAAALHAEIETWLRLADDLGPEGIPAELLHSAIDPINERLSYSGNSLGFMGLSLTPEMELVGRPEENDPGTPRRYELLSESARWRAEAALADAIGQAIEYRDNQPIDAPIIHLLPMVLDRFDVLDGPGRSKAIRWLLSLGRQVILLGTLRNRDIPQSVPDELAIHWLQAGHLMGDDNDSGRI